jgi:hypothetical protein
LKTFGIAKVVSRAVGSAAGAALLDPKNPYSLNDRSEFSVISAGTFPRF